MKTIGLLGGMSWESSAVYYRLINEAVRERLGGSHSAQSILYSVDFATVDALQRADDWDAAARMLGEASRALERAGADLLVLCTNTMHRVAGELEAAISIPLLHIADPTAAAIRADGIDRVGLLGTSYTMEGAFYRDRLEARDGLRVLVPGESDRRAVHRVIFDELVVGTISDASRARYRSVIDKLVADGADGVILGCTEIGLLVSAEDSPVPVYDTTVLHARAAAEAALG